MGATLQKARANVTGGRERDHLTVPVPVQVQD